MEWQMGLIVTFAAAAVLAVGCASQDMPSEPQSAGPTGEPPAAFQGRCHCGKIVYEARTPIAKCSYCGCSPCRHATGALKVPFVTVPPQQFRVTAGKPAVYRQKLGGTDCDAHGTWQYCPDCGGPLFWKANDGSQIDIFAGTLDDPSLFQVKAES